MKAFLSTCLLLALFLPEVANLFCRDYEAPFEICEIDNGFCVEHLVHGYLNGSTIDGKAKVGCATNCPSMNYSFTTSQGYIQNDIHCCQEDLCINRYPAVPSRGGFNGRKCEACHASGSEGCSDLNTVRCHGAETQCISFVIVHNDNSVPDDIYKGCASPSFCDMARKSLYTDYLEGTITKARCCDTLPSSEQL